MSPVANGSVLAARAAPQLLQASKRTRIELLAAQNDHNYSAAAPNNAGRMDDCTAAMVLMYLSSRPGEELREHSGAPLGNAAQDESNICKRTAALDEPGAKFAVMKRNSEPIEMNLESQTRRLKHFKRQLPAAHELEPEELELEAKQTRTSGEESQSKRRPIGSSDACDFGREARDEDAEAEDEAEDEEEDERAGKAEAPEPSGQLEDEMMFELQQVDQVEPAAQQAVSKSSAALEKEAERAQSSVPPRPPPLPVASERRPQRAHGVAMLRDSLESCERAGGELGRLAAFELIGSHPQAKKRTIFSCMWPSCPKNCDSLDDIERHVRAHLGPNSIGDEDFYYEETEVDEPTYLAIFGPRHSLGARGHAYCQHHAHQLPLSPSHNSDGLSSGHSLAGSSPATSPLCSADSSSASSSSALSTSSLSSSASSATFQLDGLTGSATAGAKSQLLAASSLEWSSFLAGSPAAGWPSRKQQQLGHHQNRHQQQQAALFSLDAYAAAGSPRLTAGLKGSRRQSGKFASFKAANGAGRKRAQQIQEQLRASIIEQLHSQRHPRQNLQFSMQLNDSSLQLDHANYAAGGLCGRPRKFAARPAASDHQYGGEPPPPPPAPSAKPQGLASSLASHIKSRRGRRPSAKLAEQAEMLAAASAKQTAKRPQLFQDDHADCFHSAASANSAANSRQLLPHSPPLSGASSPSSGSGGGGGGGGGGKRVRGENRKCRKVYGMEQREQWCTQCKWKKACSRFCDQQQ